MNWIDFDLRASSSDRLKGPLPAGVARRLTVVRLKAKMRIRIEHYLSRSGRDAFQQWLNGLADLRCRVAVLRRVDRLADGNPGDYRFCRDGVWELRVDCGPGYRVYFARASSYRTVLLCGGSKRSQSADIATAAAHWADYKERQ